MSKQGKRSEISFNVDLNEDNIPEKITWQASDSGHPAPKECKSIMVSIWDHEDKNTLRIDLWTKDMRLDEMDTHFFQTLVTLAETYQKATNNNFVVDEMNKFCKSLAEKINEEMRQQ